MLHGPSPVFGKRNVPRSSPSRPKTPGDPPGSSQRPLVSPIEPDQAAFFAAVRADMAPSTAPTARRVPSSYKAAWLTGLVVGCALVGFDVTGQAGTERLDPVAGLLGVRIDTSSLLPAMILLGLFAGARAAAMTVFCAHAALSRVGWNSHAAYMLGGAAASVASAALMQVTLGSPPEHGWLVELAAGAGAGLCYRAIAGVRELPARS